MQFRISVSDLLFNGASVGLAVLSALFAVIMIFEIDLRQKQETGPLAGRQPSADPIITGSLAVQRKPSDFRVLAVVDGTAFIEIAGATGPEIWPVGEGSHLPGAGTVLGIEKIGGRWQIFTSQLLLSEADQ